MFLLLPEIVPVIVNKKIIDYKTAIIAAFLLHFDSFKSAKLIKIYNSKKKDHNI